MQLGVVVPASTTLLVPSPSNRSCNPVRSNADQLGFITTGSPGSSCSPGQGSSVSGRASLMGLPASSHARSLPGSTSLPSCA